MLRAPSFRRMRAANSGIHTVRVCREAAVEGGYGVPTAGDCHALAGTPLVFLRAESTHHGRQRESTFPGMMLSYLLLCPTLPRATGMMMSCCQTPVLSLADKGHYSYCFRWCSCTEAVLNYFWCSRQKSTVGCVCSYLRLRHCFLNRVLSRTTQRPCVVGSSFVWCVILTSRSRQHLYCYLLFLRSHEANASNQCTKMLLKSFCHSTIALLKWGLVIVC